MTQESTEDPGQDEPELISECDCDLVQEPTLSSVSDEKTRLGD